MPLFPAPLSRYCRRTVTIAAAALVCSGIERPTFADPYSDTFQPDFFGTRAALQKRTPGLNDPFARACTLPAEPLSLAVAIDLALCRNPATRSTWAAAHQQAAALGSAESALLPNISGTGSATRAFGGHQDGFGTLEPFDQTTRDAAVNLTWTLYDFGRRAGAIRSARYLLDAAAATAGSVTQQTVFALLRDYYGVVAADAGLAAAQITETTAAHSLEIARARQSGGVGALADTLQAETAYNQAVLARIQAAQTATAARGGLSVEIGSTADQPLKLAADPVPTQVPALTARMEDLMAEAARQRPDLAAARAERDAAIANITVARASGWPSISITTGHSKIDQTRVPTQNFSEVGISVSVPIFTGFSVGYSVRAAQAELEAREVNVEQVRLNVTLDVWNGYYSLDSANQQLATTATLVATAQKNEDVAIGRYQAGVGTIIDVITAQGSASTARQLRITAELNWEVARAQFALALGRLSGVEPLNVDPTDPR